MIFHKAEEVFFFPGEDRANVISHFIAVAAGLERDVTPREASHRVKLHEVEVVLTFAADLGEDFVEREFLVEEGGAGIKRVGAKVDPGVSATDAFFFFQNGDLVAAMCKKHSGGESAGSCSDNYNVLLQMA